MAEQKRDKTLDVLKGIGIILMVVGHSGSPCTNFIYLFHMALFFVASGYVWNDKKVKDFTALKQGLLARVRGLWLPYTVGNGIFTLLNNGFVQLGLYPEELRMTTKQMVVNLAKNLLFAGDTRFGGASWFLRTLFIVSVGHLLVRYVVCRMKHGRVAFGVVVALTLIGAEVINQTHWKFPMGAETVFCGYAAFLFGMLMRRWQFPQRLGKYQWIAAPAAFVVLFLLGRFDNVGLGAGNIGSNLLFFVAVTLSGWVLTWGVSSLARGAVADALAYCGRHTMWVVMVHFLSFKPVAYIYLRIVGGDMSGLSAFPAYTAKGLWIAYSIVGILLPLALEAIYLQTKRGIRSLKR